MRKVVVLLPLLVALLTCNACSCSGKKTKKKTTEESVSTSEVPSDTSEELSTSTYVSGPKKAEDVEEGENHSLPWNLDYDNFKDDEGSLSYLAYNKTYDFGGTNVYAYGMRAVTDISVSINGSLTTFKGFKILHLCKMGHETWIDGGQLQISKIQPSKLVLELVSYGNYDYKASQTLSVYCGERLIAAPTTANISVSPVREEFKVQTITFDINAEAPSMIKLQNRNRFSMYIQSMRFE